MVIGRNSSPPAPEIDGATAGNGGAGNDVGFHSIRDRFPLKRNPLHYRDRPRTSADRQLPRTSRSHPNTRFNRKGLLWLFPFKGKSGIYVMIIFVVFLFALASMVMQSSITSVFRQGSDRGRLLPKNLKFGSTLKFVPGKVSKRFVLGDGLDRVRSQPRIGVRPPRLALVSLSCTWLFPFDIPNMYLYISFILV